MPNKGGYLFGTVMQVTSYPKIMGVNKSEKKAT